MAFIFRFEKLLSQRKLAEDLGRKDYIEVLQRYQIEKDKLAALYRSIDEARKNVGESEHKGGTIGEILLQAHQFIHLTELKIHQQKLVVRDSQGLVDHYQELLKEKAIDRKIVEKLREKDFDEFKEARKKHEEKVANEMSILRHRPKAD